MRGDKRETGVQVNYCGVTLARSPEIVQERRHCGGGGKPLGEQNARLG